MPHRLAQHLVSRGLLGADRVEASLRQQAVAGGSLDTVLLEQGLVSEAGMLQALADASGVHPVNLADFEPNLEVAGLIPPKIAERLTICPLSLEGSVLHVACSYPVPTQALQEVGFLLGKQLELWVALECRVREWISILYKTPLSARFSAVLAAIDPNRPMGPPAPEPPPAAPLPATAPGAPVQTVIAIEEVTELGDEVPILLEVKKRPGEPPKRAQPPPTPPVNRTFPSPSANPYDRVETVLLDRSGYAAFAREALKKGPATPPVPPPVPVRLDSARHERSPFRASEVEADAPQDEETSFAGLSDPPEAAGPAQLAPPAAPAPAVIPPVPETWSVPEPAHAVKARPLPSGGAPLPMPPAPAAPAAPPLAAPTEVVPDIVPEWSLAEARAALREASSDREALIDVALRYGRRAFEFVGAFAVVRGNAVGWSARGEGASPGSLHHLSVPLDAASVFRTVALTRGSYVGPVPSDPLTRHYLEQMGRGPRSVFLFPVEVKARLVAILYGDCGQRPMSQRRLSDFILFCQDLPGAFQELILFRKQHGLGGGLSAPATEEPAAPVLPERVFSIEPDEPTPPLQVGWSPGIARAASGPGRAASMPGLGVAEAERPPPDFGVVLRRLTGPDAAQRARAMAELSRSPEASARMLAAAFPGPTAWSRLPVVELPEADELGPIPGALARLGRVGAQALAPLLDSDDSDARYFALLTAGNLPYPELVDGVLRGLFDFEPDISSAARAAATALRRLPRFDGKMKDLRQELAARDPLRRSLAARSLGALHDRESIEGLIGLTGSDDQMCAQAAAEALEEITKASFGTQPRSWTRWWAENRGRRRVEWLVAALRHPELDLRLAAIEELSRAFHDNLGFFADGPPAEREAAVRQWEATIAQPGRIRGDLW